MKDLKEIFNKKEVSRESLSFGHSADSDWRLILISAIVLVILISALDVKIFLKINSSDIPEPTSTEEPSNTVDLEKLRAAIKYYQGKELQFEKIRSNTATSTVVDPSI